LQRKEFREVYDHGFRFTCESFSAWCLRKPDCLCSRFGFTTPRAVGKATIRNRLRRRLREQLRLRRAEFPAGWWVVLHPRRVSEEHSAAQLALQLERLMRRCAGSSS
jgi:ribonuclease P protein component